MAVVEAPVTRAMGRYRPGERSLWRATDWLCVFEGSVKFWCSVGGLRTIGTWAGAEVVHRLCGDMV